MASLISSIVPSPSVFGRLIWINPDLIMRDMGLYDFGLKNGNVLNWLGVDKLIMVLVLINIDFEHYK
jgi:hypothetical protein